MTSFFPFVMAVIFLAKVGFSEATSPPMATDTGKAPWSNYNGPIIIYAEGEEAFPSLSQGPKYCKIKLTDFPKTKSESMPRVSKQNTFTQSELLEVLPQIKQEDDQTAIHLMAAIPSRSIWAYWPRQVRGPFTRFYIERDYSKMTFKGSQTAKKLRKLVYEFCGKNEGIPKTKGQ